MLERNPEEFAQDMESLEKVLLDEKWAVCQNVMYKKIVNKYRIKNPEIFGDDIQERLINIHRHLFNPLALKLDIIYKEKKSVVIYFRDMLLNSLYYFKVRVIELIGVLVVIGSLYISYITSKQATIDLWISNLLLGIASSLATVLLILVINNIKRNSIRKLNYQLNIINKRTSQFNGQYKKSLYIIQNKISEEDAKDFIMAFVNFNNDLKRYCDEICRNISIVRSNTNIEKLLEFEKKIFNTSSIIVRREIESHGPIEIGKTVTKKEKDLLFENTLEFEILFQKYIDDLEILIGNLNDKLHRVDRTIL